MKKIIFCLVSVFALTACDQKTRELTAEEVKVMYDKMSDEQIRHRWYDFTLAQCKQQVATHQTSKSNPIKDTQGFCKCTSEKFINKIDIRVLRLALLPETALTAEQKLQIQRQMGNPELFNKAMAMCL
ncbi:hypothetical protein A4G18_08785 [Pasteurellaceae bacterium Pebbles2]|nr:hypothetical protein [Pasteurellaceae bacterium Pebbles2]